jgi:hypothetical protein
MELEKLGLFSIQSPLRSPILPSRRSEVWKGGSLAPENLLIEAGGALLAESGDNLILE